MQSITHSFQKILLNLLFSDKKAKQLSEELIAPMVFNASVLHYAGLISYVDAFSKQLACDLIKTILEKMDFTFNYSPGRTERYYVNHYRERTIITIFGPVTYKRREYRDRSTGKPFIYVDREIGLLNRQRYDMCVSALAYSMYSDSNSMIKVGKQLEQFISPFTLNNNGIYSAIPRQTIFNMNNRFKFIKTPVIKRDETPETIYIMADEKWIHLQGERRDGEDKHKRYSEMTKLGIIFTGREECVGKDGQPLKRKRWKLTGKHIISFPHDSNNFWEHTLCVLNELFDLDKVKNIYILGDGASWIKNGVKELKMPNITVKYGLDRFHLTKAIHKLTKEKEQRNLIYDYAINGKRKDLVTVFDSFFPNESRSEAQQRLIDYILKNLKGAKVMNKEVKIGCGMEQAIQHILASNFTSVPKAYGKEHLHTYVNARTSQQNHHNMILTYLQASDISKDNGDGIIDLSPQKIDLSFFNDMTSNPYYSVNLNTSTYEEITKF